MRGWSNDWEALFASTTSTPSSPPRLGVDYVQASAASTSIALSHSSASLRIHQDLARHSVAGVVWNCARAMVAFFQAESHLVARRHVLELGAGPGAVGLALAADCDLASLLLTDLAEVVPFTSQNARAVAQQHAVVGAMQTENRLDIQELCWGERMTTVVAARTVDVVVASDCLYEPKAHAALLSTLLELTGVSDCSQQQSEAATAPTPPRSVTVFLAYKQRVPSIERPFFEAAAQYFTISIYSAADAEDTRPNNSRTSSAVEYFEDAIYVCKLERRLEEPCASYKAEPKC